MHNKADIVSGSPSSSRAQRTMRRACPEAGVQRFDEETIIRRFLQEMSLTEERLVLDLGCGKGEKMKWVKDAGYNVRGVDINPNSVAIARAKGFDCVTVQEFEQSSEQYDTILASHIVEHFSPAELLSFMDYYLDRLKVGGYLLISTPLEHANFYTDFDHVKVYHPEAFATIFSVPESQVQYHARNRLQLVDLRLRRVPTPSPRYLNQYESFYRESIVWRCWHRGGAVLRKWMFVLSGGVIAGKSTGWVGLFKKLG